MAATAHAQITNISVTNVSLTPASGSSASGVIQTFTATYSDSYGSGDIVDTYFQAKAAYTSCYVQYDSPTNGFTLLNDSGTSWLGPISPGSSSTLQNSVCTLYGTGSSVAAGSQFTMTLSLSFTAQFAGTNATYLSAYGNLGGTSAFQQMGTWTVNASNYPDLTIAMNHSPASFTQGQSGSYAITVSNNGSASTSGTITVTDSTLTGLTASSISGTGWSCTQPAGPCSRSDALAAGGSYPVLSFTVAAASNAPTTVTNYGYVSGGGETNTSNDTATDVTTIATSGGGSGDLALGKTATQSSTYSDTTPPIASLAVDGNTDGNYFDRSVSTTNYDQNAWWQVDLGSSTTVNTVVVWNRTDCCNPPRLVDYWVFVSTTPFLSTDTPATLQGRAGTWSSHQTTAPSPSATVSPNGYPGRYVRVQLTGTNYLSLAEVQVFGTAGGSVPDLTVTMNHSPTNFTQGQTGTYNITVTNSGAAATNGTQVNVIDPLTAGLTATSMNGSGWSCTQPGGPCTRSDALAVGGSYSPIALAVSVGSNAASSLAPTVTVSGGGETNTSNDTATDTTTIIPCCGGGTLATMANPPPGSQLTGSTVTFTWYAASGATQYGLYVGTTGIGSADILSANTGLNLTQQVTGLPVNGNTVYVRLFTYFSTSWQSIDYTYAAFGCGGSCAPVLTISKSHIGNFTQGQAGSYTITVGNNGTGATNGSLVTASDTLPQGLTFGSMSGTGWNCSGASCSRSDALAAGNSYPPITLGVNVSGTAPSSVTNQATVSGGGSGSNTASDITTIGPAGPLPNPSFESGSSTTVSNSQQYSSVPSAASGWMIYNNAANTTTTTELCTATSCPSGSSSPMQPADGTHTMHITTGGQWNGIYETFNSTALTAVSMTLKVVSGTVLVELIGAAPPYTYTVVSTSGPMTLAANGAFNEIVIYSASSGAEFYVDNVILTPGVPSLLPNPSFEVGSSTPVSNSQQYSSVPSAASGWMIYNNTANTTTTTELCTATSCPSGSSSPMQPADGSHTMHITTGGQWNGIYETFNSTALASVSMSLKVVSGTVLVELIGAAPPYTYTVVSTSGPMTLAANGAFNEIVIYSASSGAEFYVDNVILAPGGTGTVSITLTSSPTGLGLAIDGIGCTTPCATQTWAAGSTHTIGAGTQLGATGVQYVFTGWADGGTASPRTVTPSVSTTYTANFTTQYLLTTSATTGGTISPGSEWVNSGGVVAVSASASTGYQFTRFSGALTGTTTPQNLTMNGPASVVANFSQIAPPDFTITVTSSSPMNVVRPSGGPVTYYFTVEATPINGFTGRIDFNNFSGLPANTTTTGTSITVGAGAVSAQLPIIVYSTAAIGSATITFNAYATINGVTVSHPYAAYITISSGPPPALSSTCMASPNTAAPFENVNFVAIAQGGTLPYKYTWSGAVQGTGSGRPFTPSAAGTYYAQVVVTDSASPTPQTAPQASCSLTVNNWIPATIVSPASGAILTGSAAATFSWNSASGASQYKLLLGSTAGGSDFGSVNAGTATSTTLQLPSGNPPMTIWATLGSQFAGQWLFRYYAYQVAANPSSPAPSTIVNAPPLIGSDMPHFASNNCDSSQLYTICDDGSQLTLYYQITSAFPSGITSAGISCQWDDSLLVIDSSQAPLANGATNAFSLTVHANPGVRTGGHGLTCQLPSLPACSGSQTTGCLQGGADALTVYDATPVITDVAPDAGPPGQPPALVSQGGQITIMGANFGPTTGGTLELCDLTGITCNPISTLTWSSNQITALINASPGQYTVQVVATGSQGTRFLADPSVTSPDSNTWEVDVAPPPSLVVTSNGQSLPQGGLVFLDATPSLPTIQATIANSRPGDMVTYTAEIRFTQTNPDCTVTTTSRGGPIGPPAPQPASSLYTLPFPIFGNQGFIHWAYNGSPQPDFTFNILGMNPQQDSTAVLNQLNGVTINGKPVWFTRNVAIHETNESQFFDRSRGTVDSTTWCQTTHTVKGAQVGGPNSPGATNNTPAQLGMPLYGFPGGYGIMQLDPPVTPDGIWIWQKNISDWQDRFSAQAGPENDTSSTLPHDPRAYPFWFRQVLQWQAYNSGKPNDQQIPWPGDPGPNFSPNCAFQAPSLTSPPARSTANPYWYGDAILMKQISGAPINYISWNNTDPNNPPFWSFTKDNSVSCDIVYEFCTCTSPNPRNCLQPPKTQCGLQ